MSNVHEEITKHSKNQHLIVRTFIELEAKREIYIDEAVSLAEQQKPFSVGMINKVTQEMNRLAKKGIVPTRKIVTEEMVKEYVTRKQTRVTSHI